MSGSNAARDDGRKLSGKEASSTYQLVAGTLSTGSSSAYSALADASSWMRLWIHHHPDNNELSRTAILSRSLRIDTFCLMIWSHAQSSLWGCIAPRVKSKEGHNVQRTGRFGVDCLVSLLSEKCFVGCTFFLQIHAEPISAQWASRMWRARALWEPILPARHVALHTQTLHVSTQPRWTTSTASAPYCSSTTWVQQVLIPPATLWETASQALTVSAQAPRNRFTRIFR